MLLIERPEVRPNDVVDAIRNAFLRHSADVAPGQFTVDLPDGGDLIHYPGHLPEERVYAVKLSPYLPRSDGRAIVTAWTLLMSTETGRPLALLNARDLTVERTAATSVLAADLLMPSDATRATIVGWGAVARRHARYLQLLRPRISITVWARTMPGDLPEGVLPAESLDEAVRDADLVMLCTSAADDVLDPRVLRRSAVVTSISTNAPGAREIPVEAVCDIDVYLDAPSTSDVATELKSAAGRGWDPSEVRGTLSDLVTGRVPRSRGERVAYFRSVGLGLEDAAIAWAAYRAYQKENA